MKDKPKVFLFGTNCASVMNSLTIGFEQSGIDVRSVTFDFNRSNYNNFSKIQCICTDNYPNKLKLYFYKFKALFVLIRYLLWCDIVHVYGMFSKPVFWLIAMLAKYKFVTFVGSEIRVPEVELAINPYYKYGYDNPAYENRSEANNKTDQLVRFLHRLGYAFIVWDTEVYINRAITRRVQIVPHSSMNAVNGTHPGLENSRKKPLIIHSPTAPVSKGTKFVLKAIAELKDRNIPFEFKLLQNMSNEEYQHALEEADIYADQFIWGAYGIATQQAMQMGKVVVAYLTPDRVISLYGADVPIQNANIENLTDVLERLLLDPGLRSEIAERSVDYYNRMHTPQAVARKMLAAYKTLS